MATRLTTSDLGVNPGHSKNSRIVCKQATWWRYKATPAKNDSKNTIDTTNKVDKFRGYFTFSKYGKLPVNKQKQICRAKSTMSIDMPVSENIYLHKKKPETTTNQRENGGGGSSSSLL